MAIPSRLRPKNWSRFQHYTNRRPPWIKLHRELLTDRAFMTLALASRGLAPLLWLLASESDDGSFSGDLADLEFRLHVSRTDLTRGLESLLRAGFLVPASDVLAECEQPATSETEGEGETEREVEAGASAPSPSRSAPDKPPELTDQVWSDWQAHRRAIKAPLTATAIAGFRREADKAGIPFADAVVMSIAQGWRGFQAKFVKDSVPQPQRNAPVVKGPQPIFHRSDDPDCPCENCERDRRRKAQ